MERKAALMQRAKDTSLTARTCNGLSIEAGCHSTNDMVVVDEAILLQKQSGKTLPQPPICKTIRQKGRRLTGTPSSNGLMDLWAEFRILDMANG
jgi:hypothetical protein